MVKNAHPAQSKTEDRILTALFTVMDEAGLGLCQVKDFRTKSGWIERANRRFLAMIGLAQDRPLNLPITGLLPPGEIIRVLSYYRRHMRRSSQPKPYETTLLCRDGSTLPVEIHPLQPDLSQSESLLVLVRDISYHKGIEELIHNQNRMIQMLNSLSVVLQHGRDLRLIGVGPWTYADGNGRYLPQSLGQAEAFQVFRSEQGAARNPALQTI